MPQMDALALLKEDHDKAKKVMQELFETTARGVKTREEQWTKLVKELTIHENIEEQIFYPALANHPKAKDVVLEAVEEHHLVDRVTAQLKDTPFDDEHWHARFKVMQELVEHHIEEEESDMFTAAKQVFSKEELAELGTQMFAMKQSEMEESEPARERVEL